jgi:hypothetical protein
MMSEENCILFYAKIFNLQYIFMAFIFFVILTLLTFPDFSPKKLG